MNTVDDLVFSVKGKSVKAPMAEIKALPEAERQKAYMRLRALGSAVAGFTGAPAKMPPTVAAMGGAGAAPRSRSPSPKPAAKPAPKAAVKPKKEIEISQDIFGDQIAYPHNLTEFKEIMARFDIQNVGKAILANPKYKKELTQRFKRRKNEVRVAKIQTYYRGIEYQVRLHGIEGRDTINIEIDRDKEIYAPADLRAQPNSK